MKLLIVLSVLIVAISAQTTVIPPNPTTAADPTKPGLTPTVAPTVASLPRKLYTISLKTRSTAFPVKTASLFVILLDPQHEIEGHNLPGYNISLTETPKNIEADKVYTRQANSHIIPTQLTGAKVMWVNKGSPSTPDTIFVEKVIVIPTHITDEGERVKQTKNYCAPSVGIPSGALVRLTAC